MRAGRAPERGRLTRHTALPRYVERGGEMVWRPPFEFPDVRMYALVLKADQELLDGVCEMWLNAPTKGAERWHAAGDHLLLTFVYLSRVQSADHRDHDFGSMVEREVGIWVPVVDMRRGRFAWMVPYIWVDNDAALAGGREVWGFPKQMGHIHVPEDGSIPDEMSLTALSIPWFSPRSIAAQHPVMTVRRMSEWQSAPDHWHSHGDLARSLGQLPRETGEAPDIADARAELDAAGIAAASSARPSKLSQGAVAALFGRQMLSMAVPMVFLKQFRDVDYPALACYQAVVEATNRLTGLHGAGLLPTYSVEIANLASVPLQRELGLKAGTHEPVNGFFVDFSFRIETGAVLWEHDGRQGG